MPPFEKVVDAIEELSIMVVLGYTTADSSMDGNVGFFFAGILSATRRRIVVTQSRLHLHLSNNLHRCRKAVNRFVLVRLIRVGVDLR